MPFDPNEWTAAPIGEMPEEEIPEQDFMSYGMDYLQKNYGWKPEAAAGIIGTLYHESAGGNPVAIGDAGASVGLAQWNQERLDGLAEFAAAQEMPMTDRDIQLDYLHYEMARDYPGLIDDLNAAETPEEAAEIFTNVYERPGRPMMPHRRRAARQAYEGGIPAVEKIAASAPPGVSKGAAPDKEEWSAVPLSEASTMMTGPAEELDPKEWSAVAPDEMPLAAFRDPRFMAEVARRRKDELLLGGKRRAIMTQRGFFLTGEHFMDKFLANITDAIGAGLYYGTETVKQPGREAPVLDVFPDISMDIGTYPEKATAKGFAEAVWNEAHPEMPVAVTRSQLPRGAEKLVAPISKILRDVGKTWASWAPEAPPGEETVEDQVYFAFGGLPWMLAKYGTVLRWLGPIAGMAAIDAIESYDQGPLATAEGLLRGTVWGTGFKGLEPFKIGAKVGGMATLGVLMSATGGGGVKEMASGGFTMGILGFMSGGGDLTARRAISDAWRQFKPAFEEMPIEQQRAAWARAKDFLKSQEPLDDLMNKFFERGEEARRAKPEEVPFLESEKIGLRTPESMDRQVEQLDRLAEQWTWEEAPEVPAQPEDSVLFYPTRERPRTEVPPEPLESEFGGYERTIVTPREAGDLSLWERPDTFLGIYSTADGEAPLPNLRSFKGPAFTMADFAEKNLPKLRQFVRNANTILTDTDAFVNSKYYDGSYPVPRMGGLEVAKQLSKYRDDPVYKAAIDDAYNKVASDMADASKKIEILEDAIEYRYGGGPDTSEFFEEIYDRLREKAKRLGRKPKISEVVEANEQVETRASTVPEIQRGPGGKVIARYGMDVARAWNQSARNKYGDWYLGDIAIREALQNSIDAVLKAMRTKKIRNGRIDITVHDDNLGYTIEDNGVGMTDLEILQKFLALYGTGKDTELDVGGFGIAKAVILAPHESATWELWTQDNYCTHEIASGQKEIETTMKRQGTKISVRAPRALDQYTNKGDLTTYRAKQFVEASEFPKGVRVFFNGEEVKFPFKGKRNKVYFDKNITSETHAKMTYYPEPPAGYKSRIIGRLAFPDGRMLIQSNEPIYRAGVDGALMVDIKTSATPGKSGYPWADNRNTFRLTIDAEVNKVLEGFAADTASTARAGIDTQKEHGRNVSKWRPQAEKASKDVEYQEFKKKGVELGVQQTDINEMEVRYDQGMDIPPLTKDQAKMVNAFETVLRLTGEKLGLPVGKLYIRLAKVVQGKTIGGEWSSGDYGYNYTMAPPEAYINPADAYLYLKDLVDHEFVHNYVGPHNEEFTMKHSQIIRAGDEALLDKIWQVAEELTGTPAKLIRRPPKSAVEAAALLPKEQRDLFFKQMEGEGYARDTELFQPPRRPAGPAEPKLPGGEFESAVGEGVGEGVLPEAGRPGEQQVRGGVEGPGARGVPAGREGVEGEPSPGPREPGEPAESLAPVPGKPELRFGGGPDTLPLFKELMDWAGKRAEVFGGQREVDRVVRSIPYFHGIDDIKQFASRSGTVKVYHGAPRAYAEKLVEKVGKGQYKDPTWNSADDMLRFIAKTYDIPYTVLYNKTGAGHLVESYSSQKVARLSTAPAEVASRWASSFPYGEIISELNNFARVYKESKRLGRDFDEFYEEMWEKHPGNTLGLADRMALPDLLKGDRQGGVLVELEVDARALPERASLTAKSMLRHLGEEGWKDFDIALAWNTNYQDLKVHPNNIKSARIVEDFTPDAAYEVNYLYGGFPDTWFLIEDARRLIARARGIPPEKLEFESRRENPGDPASLGQLAFSINDPGSPDHLSTVSWPINYKFYGGGPDTMEMLKRAIPIWRSRMAEFIEKKLPGSGTGQGLANTIANWGDKGAFKKEELKWSGILPWLREQKGKVTKEQVLEQLKKEGAIRVRDVVKGGAGPFESTVPFSQFTEEQLVRALESEGYDEAWIADLRDRGHAALVNEAEEQAGIGGDLVEANMYEAAGVPYTRIGHHLAELERADGDLRREYSNILNEMNELQGAVSDATGTLVREILDNHYKRTGRETDSRGADVLVSTYTHPDPAQWTPWKEAAKTIAPEITEERWDLVRRARQRTRDLRARRERLWEDISRNQERIDDLKERMNEMGAKFKSYMNLPPGGENYREILLTTGRAQEGTFTELPDGYRVETTDIEGTEYWVVKDPEGYTLVTQPTREVAIDRALEALNSGFGRPGIEYRVPGPHSYEDPEADVNRFAHVFVDDRIIDGKRYLVIWEAQSDWDGRLRKEYKRYLKENYPEVMSMEPGPERTALSQKARAEFAQVKEETLERGKTILELRNQMARVVTDDVIAQELIKRMQKAEQEFNKAQIAWRNFQLSDRDLTVQEANTSDRAMERSSLHNAAVKAREDAYTARENFERRAHELTSPIHRRLERLEHLSAQYDTPDFPFSKNWHEVMFKRMLRRAIDEGYDGIAWATGDVVKARYDLTKHFERLDVIQQPDGTFDIEGLTVDGDERGLVDSVSKDDLGMYLPGELGEKALRYFEEQPTKGRAFWAIVDAEGKPISSQYPFQEDAQVALEGIAKHHPELRDRLKVKRLLEVPEDAIPARLQMRPTANGWDIYDRHNNYIRSFDEADYGGEESARDAARAYIYASRGQRLLSLRGEEMKLGGEWAESFYDKMIVDYARKYGRQWRAAPDKGVVGLQKPRHLFTIEESPDGYFGIFNKDELELNPKDAEPVDWFDTREEAEVALQSLKYRPFDEWLQDHDFSRWSRSDIDRMEQDYYAMGDVHTSFFNWLRYHYSEEIPVQFGALTTDQMMTITSRFRDAGNPRWQEFIDFVVQPVREGNLRVVDSIAGGWEVVAGPPAGPSTYVVADGFHTRADAQAWINSRGAVELHKLDATPEMRQSITTESQYLFGGGPDTSRWFSDVWRSIQARRGVSESGLDFEGMLGGMKKAWDGIREEITPWTKPRSEYKNLLDEYLGARQEAGYKNEQLQIQINKAVPDKIRQEGITNWIEAGGDLQLLRARADATTNKALKRGYEAALNLTPAEIEVGKEVVAYFDKMLKEGQAAGILDNAVTNYINHVWKKDSPTAQKLQSEINAGMLNTNFTYARKRIWATYFEGEQLGKVPKNKEVSYLLGKYFQSFYEAVAARKAIKSLTQGMTADGTMPLVTVAGKGGPIPRQAPEESRAFEDVPPDYDMTGTPQGPEAYLIRPKAVTEEQWSNYKYIDHPAFRKWKWIGNDWDGRPLLMQGDLWVHKEIFTHLNNVLGKSWFRAGPGRRALMTGVQSLKSTLLTMSPFHQVHVGTHGLMHMVNVADLPKLDFDNPVQKEAVRHGLMVYDYRGLADYSEGVYSAGLVGKIPGLGQLARSYGEYLFKDFIPRLKMKLYTEALERNLNRYGDKWSRGQICELTAHQSNAAFGELNYKSIGRSPSVQDAFRLFTLAPDFLEARLRFFGQAFLPGGKEQAYALLRGALGLYTLGVVASALFSDDKQFHWDKPFTAVIGKKEYRLRSVPGDILHLLENPRNFVYWRLNPTTVRTGMEMVTGRDMFGRRREFPQQLADFFVAHTPIPLQGLMPTRKGEQTAIEAALRTIGVSSHKYRSKAEQLMLDYFMEYRIDRPGTSELYALQKARRDVLNLARDNKSQEALGVIKEFSKNYNINPEKALRWLKEAQYPENVANFRRLPIEVMAKVMNVATTEEEKAFAPYFAEKLSRVAKTDVHKLEQVMPEVKEYFGKLKKRRTEK